MENDKHSWACGVQEGKECNCEEKGWSIPTWEESLQKIFKKYKVEPFERVEVMESIGERLLAIEKEAYSLGREEEKKGLRKEIEFFFKHETAYSGVGVRFKDMCTALEMKLLSLLSTDNNK